MNKEEIKLERYSEIEWRRKTVKISKQTIDEKVVDFIKKYMREPRYIKMPLWIREALIKTMPESNIKIDYFGKVFKYRNMRICETITISTPEEIEVF